MKQSSQSPLIIHLEWGNMKVESFGQAKDFKLWPGGAKAWDWRESNTHHRPGIQLQDIQFLAGKGCECIILSKGMLQQLETSQSVIDWCRSNDIKLHIEQTEVARELYNRLAKRGVKVGGLFHSTC